MSSDRQPPDGDPVALFADLGFSPEEIDALWAEVSELELQRAREHGAEEALARRDDEGP